MKISTQEVAHVARLARLTIDDAQLDLLAAQLGDILTYVETLNRLDTSGVEPTSHAVDICNVFRADEPVASLDRNAATANAPEALDGNFIVPKVIE
ncbi:MAG: Asp-tRNA(Asn)/Glu-tRNA(Gln) amidotransferase subunit GatC [Desulfobacteraceae bacterium]|jgi:aspartyl-tRNA(Asn)/glutamyl-tRNA(Gln) amidotransferase subunit C|nr:MAG: Asp-tRNA(Asn)/Glu-tRNA(Gln) amidotransferase subunit GatC [Desulfobacteraceae bacterium]